MIHPVLMRWCLSGAVVFSGVVAFQAMASGGPENQGLGARSEASPAGPVTASGPTSRPAKDITLVRVGDKPAGVISQEEFNSYFFGGPPVPFERAKAGLMRELVERKWFLLYLDEHPELNVDAAVREQTEKVMKNANLKDQKAFDAWLLERRMTPEIWQRLWKIQLAKAKLSELGDKKAADEEALKKLFDADPGAFNGTRLAARHILVACALYDTPEQKKAKREKAEKIREDLASGKVTWEEALKQSDDYETKKLNGNIGSFTRHEGLMEDLSSVLYGMELNKTSAVVETPFGFHILQLFRRDPSTRSFEESKVDIKKWLRREPYVSAIQEMVKKYPAVGVQAPLEPTRPPWASSQPANVLRTKPPTTMPAMTRPTMPAAPAKQPG